METCKVCAEEGNLNEDGTCHSCNAAEAELEDLWRAAYVDAGFEA